MEKESKHFIQKEDTYFLDIWHKIYSYIYIKRIQQRAKDEICRNPNVKESILPECEKYFIDLNKEEKEVNEIIVASFRDVGNAENQGDRESKESIDNIYMYQMKQIQKNEGIKSAYFGPTVFEDEVEHFGYSQGFFENFSDNTNYLKFFQFDEVSYDKDFNVEILKTLPLHNDVIKKEIKLSFYKSPVDIIRIYSDVYDILIKYFFIPNSLNTQDKEAYIGYFLYNFLETKKNMTDSVYFLMNLRQQKIVNFENEIISYLHQPEESEENISDEEELKKNQLTRFFSIFNSIFIILLNKYPNLVRKIRNYSSSYEMKQEYEVDIQMPNEHFEVFQQKNIIDKKPDYDTLRALSKRKANQAKIRRDYSTAFLYYFINLFKLKEPLKIKTDPHLGSFKDIYSFNCYLLKQHNISDKDFNFDGSLAAEDSFYEDKNKYLFDEVEKGFDGFYPDESEVKIYNERPPILFKIWKNFTRKSTSEHIDEKFNIFFGFNK